MNQGWIPRGREDPSSTRARVAVDGAVLALAYLVAGVLGASFTVGPLPLVSPAAGVALAGLVLLGLAYWPVVWVAATLVEMTHGASLGLAVVSGGGSALGAALGVLLLRGARFHPRLDRARDVMALALLGAAAGPAASTLVSSAGWAMLGGPDVQDLGARAVARALGEAVGILVVASPVFALASRPGRDGWGRGWPVEAVVGGALALTLAVLLFGGRLPATVASAALLLPLPLLLWGAFRFGLVGASGVVALFVLTGAWRTAAGSGPFAAAELLGGSPAFWAYASTLALAGLLLAALLAEHRASLALLQGVFDGPSEGILVLAGGLVVRGNAAAGRLFGTRGRERFVGVALADLFPTTQPDGTVSGEAFERHAREAQRTENHRFGWLWRRPDGSTFEADVALSPLRVEGEVGLLAVMRDVTDERLREEALRRAQEEAVHANVSKTRHLTRVSHAIRSALTSNLGFSRLLTLDGSLPQRARDHAERIHRSGLNVFQLVDEILETAKVEIGRLGLAPSSFELRPLLDEVEALFHARATEKGLELVVSVEPDVPAVVRSDRGKVRQALVNLVGNAVKFTSRGAVTAAVDGAPDPDRPSQWELRFTVSDTGPGIGAEEMDRVFRPEEDRDLPLAHTVLGLRGSLELARVLGGSLTATSREGQGTTVVLTVPVETSPRADREDGEARRVVGLAEGEEARRILVVDDLEENRTLLSALLARVGFEVRQASDGSEALQAFGAWLPHLLLMNRQMPIMDGQEATRRIKVTEEGRRTPVIMVTAGGFEDDGDEMLAAGADAVLRLPVREADLLDEVARHLGVRYVYEEAAGP